MVWAVDCRLCRKNKSYIDGATEFMREPGADETLESRHMVQLQEFYLAYVCGPTCSGAW